MPVPLLLEPLENITIDTKMNRRFARRHHNACALPEFRSFLWAFGRIGAGLVFALRDLLLNFCQRISYGSRFFGHACWPAASRRRGRLHSEAHSPELVVTRLRSAWESSRSRAPTLFRPRRGHRRAAC